MFKILIATALLSCQAFAGTILMSGGSQVTINANEMTTVVCEASPSGKLPCYCMPDSSGYYSLRTKVNGVDAVVSPSTSYSACLDYAKQNSFCLK